jgi:hypothetical protein
MSHNLLERGPNHGWQADSLDLRSPDLHDFSDLNFSRPNRLLCWSMAVIAIAAVIHFVSGARGPETQTVIAFSETAPR